MCECLKCDWIEYVDEAGNFKQFSALREVPTKTVADLEESTEYSPSLLPLTWEENV